MEINSNLLEKVRQENTEFRDLHEEHTTLKLKVKALNKTKLITPEQEVEKKKHQKLKLNLKKLFLRIQILNFLSM